MEELWAQDKDGEASIVTCAHPGTPLLVGRSIVIESWKSILQNAPDVSLENAKVLIYGGNTATVVCEEHLSSSSVVQGPSAVCRETYPLRLLCLFEQNNYLQRACLVQGPSAHRCVQSTLQWCLRRKEKEIVCKAIIFCICYVWTLCSSPHEIHPSTN